jgi:hypothetical protein
VDEKLFILESCWKVWGYHANHWSPVRTQICPTISNNLTHLRKILSHGTKLTIIDKYFFTRKVIRVGFFFPPFQRIFFEIQCCFRKVFFNLNMANIGISLRSECCKKLFYLLFKFYLETCTRYISRIRLWKDCPSFTPLKETPFTSWVGSCSSVFKFMASAAP